MRPVLPVRRARVRWEDLTRQIVELAAGPEGRPIPTDALLVAVRALGDGRTRPGARVRPHSPGRELTAQTLTVARRLVRRRQHEAALQLLDLVLDAWRPPPTSGLQAVRQHATVSLTGAPGTRLREDAAAALVGADAALDEGDLWRTAELIDVGAGLLLHRDLHAEAATSPLVEDPAAYLGPFRTSRAMALLAAGPDHATPGGRPTTPKVVARLAADHDGGPTLRPSLKVVVLTGAYPRFSRAMTAALERHGHRVRVVELTEEHRPFRYLGGAPELVHLRLRASTGRTRTTDGSWGYGVPEELLRAVLEADVVVADWVDKGAVWASLVTPPTTRLVLRAHGIDAMSLWIHAVDWSNVDAVVSVSDHQAGLVDDVLRWGAVGATGRPRPPCQVVPNIVTLPPAVARRPREPSTLGLVGWARLVKDPLWAVEVLARLRSRGGDAWRLILVGDGFPASGAPPAREYANRVRSRLAEPDMAGAVLQVGRTDDVAGEVSRLGFILSSSLRESFHQGLVEGVLGGAVPVVRDWPYFAGREGARGLYPSRWVVADVDAAVDRIWALRDPARREAAAVRAREDVMARFDPVRTGDTLARIVTGHSGPAL